MAPIAGTLRTCVILSCVSSYFAAATEAVFNLQVLNDSPASNDSAFAVFSAVAVSPATGGDTKDTLSPCCNIIDESLPGRVFFPDSEWYQTQGRGYYSLEQSDLKPSCRVSPTNVDDVSRIVKIATENKCEFAVRSGGHMTWPGASNIGPSGFTIDMRKLQTISLSHDRTMVSVGPGGTWEKVYEALRPHNLTAAGGRSSGVGVAGFLLGGGISFLSLQEGFGSDNVLAYEIVLADASIAVVTQHSRPDLYWALKYGSTNFGIVTRFDISTYPLDLVWGGSLFYPISFARPLFDALIEFTAKLAEDPKGLFALETMWDPNTQDYIIWSPSIYLEPTPFPPLFSPIESFTPISSTMRISDVAGITDEIQALFPGGVREPWFTLTLKADSQILWDIHNKHTEIFASHHHRSGFSSCFMAQPMNAGLMAAGSRNGGNPFGITEADGDLILILGSASWLDPADDDAVKAAFNEYMEWSENIARERGLLSPFLYMNYAHGVQDVMGSIGKENVDRMRSIRRAHDPHDYFRKYWKGGFKL